MLRSLKANTDEFARSKKWAVAGAGMAFALMFFSFTVMAETAFFMFYSPEGSAGALSHRLAAREMSFISPRHITNNYNFNFSGGDSSAGLAQSKDSSRRFMQTMQVNRDDSFIHALREAANTSSSNRTSHAH